MFRFHHLACSLALVLAATGCTSEEPPPPPATGSVAAPLNQTGPSTPDRRPINTIQVDHRAGRTTVNGSTSLPQGSVVEVTVLSDVDDQIIIDDLQLSTALSGGSAQLQFTATMAGTFPIRLREKNIQLTVLAIH